jgi:two-component system, OmpR family, sensor histidine kinase VicK
LRQEIERRQQAEKNLERYNRVFDIMNEFAFFFQVEADGSLVREWWTKAFEIITGFDTEEIDTRGGWFYLVHPEDREHALELVKTAKLNSDNKTSEIRIVTKQGDVCWLRVVFSSIWNESHERVMQIYGAGQDITREKALQAQQARFVTHAMHEFSHPVSSILMRLYLLRKQPERLSEHLDALQPVADHLRRMIEDMREYSSLEQGGISLQRREMALQQLLHSVISAQEEKLENSNIRLITQMPDAPVEALVDMDRIQQALSRLLLNAINLTAPGQEITVQLLNEPPDQPTHAVIILRHKGKVKDPDQPSIMFHPFYRASEGTFSHTGLELTIAREIIKLHGGSIEFRTEDGDINVFIIKLALADKQHTLPI